jgi:hypothetical protein
MVSDLQEKLWVKDLDWSLLRRISISHSGFDVKKLKSNINLSILEKSGGFRVQGVVDTNKAFFAVWH